MTRHFYTDPLAVAWMAKHFGMEFDPTFDERVHPIAKESLHLLEPKDGDYLEIKDSDDRGGAYITSVWHGHSAALGLPMDHAYRGKDFRIIQRDSKAFHWPEVEQ
jgi:hypothetical protein